MHVLLSHLLHWKGWALHSRVHGHWDCRVDLGTSTCACRTARKIKKRLEGEFEVVGGLWLAHRGQESEETVGEQEERSGCGQREGGREGARGIRNEI